VLNYHKAKNSTTDKSTYFFGEKKRGNNDGLK